MPFPLKPIDWPKPVPSWKRLDPVTVLRLVVAQIDMQTRRDVLSNKKTTNTRKARSVAAYMLVKWCGFTTKQVGVHVSGAFPTTVARWLRLVRAENPDGLTDPQWVQVEQQLEAMHGTEKH
jgi:chromosomal replication initiation ATPase DnaA